MKKQTKNQLSIWGEKINWKQRVKSVCKPCWELKYCPYGILVENFPLKSENDDKSCRIYGHDCPVYYVAEPFTETKDLRNISRSIPRSVQFRVLKRENQICSSCGNSVKDDLIEFDHIIPWSKGGSSDESNIRLLCKQCNRKRGNRFEDEYLVDSVTDHIIESLPLEVIDYFLENFSKILTNIQNIDIIPDQKLLIKSLGKRKPNIDDEIVIGVFKDLYAFFNSKRPHEINTKEFNALKFRWGFTDKKIHKLKESSIKYSIDTENLLSLEIEITKRLGLNININDGSKTKWMRK